MLRPKKQVSFGAKGVKKLGRNAVLVPQGRGYVIHLINSKGMVLKTYSMFSTEKKAVRFYKEHLK